MVPQVAAKMAAQPFPTGHLRPASVACGRFFSFFFLIGSAALMLFSPAALKI